MQGGQSVKQEEGTGNACARALYFSACGPRFSSGARAEVSSREYGEYVCGVPGCTKTARSAGQRRRVGACVVAEAAVCSKVCGVGFLVGGGLARQRFVA